MDSNIITHEHSISFKKLPKEDARLVAEQGVRVYNNMPNTLCLQIRGWSSLTPHGTEFPLIASVNVAKERIDDLIEMLRAAKEAM